MDPVHKELLRKNHQSLKRDVSKAVKGVLEYLESNTVITEDMKERVECENQTPGDRASALLYLIRTRGKNAFQAFYDAVLDAGLYDAADVLMPDLAPHGPSYTPAPRHGGEGHSASALLSETPLSDDEELPDHWPLSEQEMDTRAVIKTLHTSTRSATALQKVYDRSCLPEGQKEYYQMLHKKRGLCFIINNENFDKLEKRTGTEKDITDLRFLFQDFGFEVLVYKNQKSEEMENLLKKKVQERDHTSSDCFIMIILSHGDDGVVFGTDGYNDESGEPRNCLKVEAIRDKVCGVHSLLHKPKLIFLQACRGKQKDKGRSANDVKKEKADSSGGTQDTRDDDKEKPPAGVKESGENQGGATPQGSTDTSPPGAPASTEETQGPTHSDIDLSISRKTAENFTKPQDDVDASGESVPSRADAFLAMSTTSGFLSWRNTKSGTWFIQAIVYVFSRYAYRHEINKLMTLVNGLVSKGEVEKHGYKQICEWTPTLTKSFYFFPKLFKLDES